MKAFFKRTFRKAKRVLREVLFFKAEDMREEFEEKAAKVKTAKKKLKVILKNIK